MCFLIFFSTSFSSLLLIVTVSGPALKASLLIFCGLESQETELVELYALGEDLWGIPRNKVDKL